MAPAHRAKTQLSVSPDPLFELSPNLYMQFMEPLGTTDTSCEAGWDFTNNCWRTDLIDATRDLGAPMIRWGGCFLSYYRWKEGVGPRSKRVPIHNMCWKGIETNQIGTHEFIDFCQQTGAAPLICVNLEGDGKEFWRKDPNGSSRFGSAREAADWVDYCNNPANAQRKKNGARNPFNVKFWQLGNETSYGIQGETCFDCDSAITHTISFAKAMRKKDPSITLLSWGDSGWAPRMIDEAGDHFEYISFHHHFNSGLKNSPLTTNEYRKDPDRTWRHLMNAWKSTDTRIREMKKEIAGSGKFLALTESHFALAARNRGEVLSTWAAGVSNARILNVHERHGDLLKIATLADFCGNRWFVNALMIPTPGWSYKTYLMPVARVMQLYTKHSGSHALKVLNSPDGLDVTASRKGRKVFLHVVNTLRTKSVRVNLAVDGLAISKAVAHEICNDPMIEIDEFNPDLFAPVVKTVPESLQWSFPAASVSAVELTVKKR